MYTLTVDDRELVVTLMLGILRNLDPDGTHLGATDPQEALRLAKDLHLQASGIAAPSPKGKTYWKARLREMLGWGLYVRNRCFRALGIKANFRAR